VGGIKKDPSYLEGGISRGFAAPLGGSAAKELRTRLQYRQLRRLQGQYHVSSTQQS